MISDDVNNFKNVEAFCTALTLILSLSCDLFTLLAGALAITCASKQSALNMPNVVSFYQLKVRIELGGPGRHEASSKQTQMISNYVNWLARFFWFLSCYSYNLVPWFSMRSERIESYRGNLMKQECNYRNFITTGLVSHLRLMMFKADGCLHGTLYCSRSYTIFVLPTCAAVIYLNYCFRYPCMYLRLSFSIVMLLRKRSHRF